MNWNIFKNKDQLHDNHDLIKADTNNSIGSLESMTENQDILNEYRHELPSPNRFYVPSIILFGIFICFLTLNLFISIERLTWHGFNGDWVDILLSVLIPVCGLSLFIAKKKSGWLISMTYISFIAIAAIITTCLSIFTYESEVLIETFKVRHIFILMMTTSLSILFQTKSTRKYFKVGIFMWLSGIIIALCLACAVIFLS